MQTVETLNPPVRNRLSPNGKFARKGRKGHSSSVTPNLDGNRITEERLKSLSMALSAAAQGDFSVRLETRRHDRSVMGQIARKFNEVVARNEATVEEIARVERVVRREGRMHERARLKNASGGWKDILDSINDLIGGLVQPTTEVARVIMAVAHGDLSQKIALAIDGAPVEGEFLRIAMTVNSMVDQLSSFAAEVTRVAREVGVEGKLGGQAWVPGLAGTWKDLTYNVNFMASNLTTQVRGIVKVVTAVAQGDLTQKLVGVEAKGEIAALANTINNMTETLGTFADQVSTVAREVGIEGKLGGQAKVPGAAGTWRDLTDNVNQLAGNLTSQVRAISEVATAVTTGDLTRSIKVEAEGEVAELKDKINRMIINLRETTQKNMEQDWLKTNLARFSSMLQGQKTLQSVSRLIMSELTPLVSAHQGAFFLMDTENDVPSLRLINGYGYRRRKGLPNRFLLGEGLIGQCALEKKTIMLTEIPPDYIRINSGLGEASPRNIIIIPILSEGEVKAVLELASLHPFSTIHQSFLHQVSETIGVVVNVIVADTRTEKLLQQSQSLTQELQNQSHELKEQQEALKMTNAALEKQALELAEKAELLEEQNAKVEEKNREVEQARKSLEEKAEQLARVSRYKSEFLANMSHELRTPLNSLMILAKVLSENEEGNLTSKQLEYARSINASGGDLLKLINQVLDLTKVESGRIEIELRDTLLEDLRAFIATSFRAVAEHKGLEFTAEIAAGTPAVIRTDPERLHQVLKNLLDNAFKFTERGGVRLRIGRAEPGLSFDSPSLAESNEVIAISVTDTGIGIPKEKHGVIFEAFRQADGTTSRRYGGTGLGLSISLEITRLLGGEIRVESSAGEGSTFTLYLPARQAKIDRSFGENASETKSWEDPHAESTERSSIDVLPLVKTKANELPDIVGAGSSNRSHRPAEESPISIAGKKALVIDDDIRNIFAVTSLLERHRMRVIFAEDGRSGIKSLRENPDIEVVLMDIMMPELDGYEAIRQIRSEPAWKTLPIIAVTARALDEDREQCFNAGASDYLAKPIEEDRLITLIELWTSPGSKAA